MGLSQMSSLTGGRRFKKPYVDEINARSKYLPATYATKKEDAYRDKVYGLQEKGLAQEGEFARADLALREDALDEQKKAQKKANRLGYANIGLGAGAGLAGMAGGSDFFKSGPDVDDIEMSEIGVGLWEPTTDVAKQTIAESNPVTDIGLGLWEPGSDVLKQVGGGLWDAGKGIYDSIVGNFMDSDVAGGIDDMVGSFI